MKYREMTDPNSSAQASGHIESLWREFAHERSSTLRRVLGYLFVLNSGGLVAAVTYMATKPTVRWEIPFSIWCFAIGTILITIHAAIDYYTCEGLFGKFRSDVAQFFKNEIDWEVLWDRTRERKTGDWILHLLGIGSGVVFVVGLAVGVGGLGVFG